MSEPTKEQIDEVIALGNRFNTLRDSPEICAARIIANVRTQATNDALERAALKCEQLGKGNHMAFGYDCAEAVRALQVPT